MRESHLFLIFHQMEFYTDVEHKVSYDLRGGGDGKGVEGGAENLLLSDRYPIESNCQCSVKFSLLS